jgi:2-phosphoglycerate kinase
MCTRFYNYILLLFIFSSCDNHESNFRGLAAEIAIIECRAEKLKDHRFALADRMRFTQDTILQKSKDTMELHNQLLEMEKEKQLLLIQSLKLADTIKRKMEFLMTNYLTDKKKENEFNQFLKEEIKKNKGH